MGRDYPNDSITENGQNTEKSPGDLRRFAVTQTLVKNSKGVNDNNIIIIIYKSRITFFLLHASPYSGEDN